MLLHLRHEIDCKNCLSHYCHGSSLTSLACPSLTLTSLSFSPSPLCSLTLTLLTLTLTLTLTRTSLASLLPLPRLSAPSLSLTSPPSLPHRPDRQPSTSPSLTSSLSSPSDPPLPHRTSPSALSHTHLPPFLSHTCTKSTLSPQINGYHEEEAREALISANRR